MNFPFDYTHTKILNAATFAAHHHRFQKRGDVGGTAYINHPLAVANRIANVGLNDADILQAALLHDLVEDTHLTIEDIKDNFGDIVAGYVAEVTDDKTLPKRKRRLSQIKRASTLSSGAAFIKLSDKIDNLNDLCYYPPKWKQLDFIEYAHFANNVVENLKISFSNNKLSENELERSLAQSARVADAFNKLLRTFSVAYFFTLNKYKND